jgi:uncharacterized membrane protein HdeD (DUF308 family)
MSDNTSKEMDKKELSQSNLWTAIVLGVIALIVGIMPFFYLADMAAK